MMMMMMTRRRRREAEEDDGHNDLRDEDNDNYDADLNDGCIYIRWWLQDDDSDKL